MNAEKLLRTHALNDLRRLIPPDHYLMRAHSPAADQELARPLLAEPELHCLTPLEHAAAHALADLAFYQVRSRALWSKSSRVSAYVEGEVTKPKAMPETDREEISARREVFRRSALTYATMLSEAELIRTYQAPPERHTEPHPQSARAKALSMWGTLSDAMGGIEPLTPAQRSQQLIGWYLSTMNADHWLSLTDIEPGNAAMLLCAHDPNQGTLEQARRSTTDKTGPDDFLRLLQRFEDLAKCKPQHRSLRQWLEFAQASKLRYDHWIDEYIEAGGTADVPGRQLSTVIWDVPCNDTPKQRAKKVTAQLAEHLSGATVPEEEFADAVLQAEKDAALRLQEWDKTVPDGTPESLERKERGTAEAKRAHALAKLRNEMARGDHGVIAEASKLLTQANFGALNPPSFLSKGLTEAQARAAKEWHEEERLKREAGITPELLREMQPAFQQWEKQQATLHSAQQAAAIHEGQRNRYLELEADAERERIRVREEHEASKRSAASEVPATPVGHLQSRVHPGGAVATAEPLEWSTLDEAASWLAARTGEAWTPRRVVDVVRRQTKEKISRSNKASAAAGVPAKDWVPSNPHTPIRAAPPPECEFIQHPLPMAHPPGELHFASALPWRTLPLRLIEVDQLLAAGELILKAADGRGGERNEKGVPLYVEEVRPPTKVTLANVVLKSSDLLTLVPEAVEPIPMTDEALLRRSAQPDAMPSAPTLQIGRAAIAKLDEAPAVAAKLPAVAADGTPVVLAQTAAEQMLEVNETRPPEDHSALATRTQLIVAFGGFTGMNLQWFKNLKDTPALLKARKVVGVGTRRKKREPLFCPMEVMQWLIDLNRKKGRAFHNIETPWRLLEEHFPASYARNSVGDPREKRTG